MMQTRWLLALLVSALPACGPKRPPGPPAAVQPDGPRLPASLAGRVTVLPPDSPAAADAALDRAVKDPGLGGLAEGWAVRLTGDLTVYRLWNGPDEVDDSGHTNRLGQWWAADAPAGPVEDYRVDYEVCTGWNDLAWVATCTLTAGSVVAVGPGQSVSEQTCGEAGETYPENPVDWQVYVDRAWARPEALACPDPAADHAADPADLSRPLPDTGTAE